MTRQSEMSLGLKHAARIKTKRMVSDASQKALGKGLGSEIAVSIGNRLISHLLKSF